ncbi:MAG: hypothetical protein QXJ65_04765 [Acidilobaceae archaeon]
MDEDLKRIIVLALILRLIIAPFTGHLWDLATIQDSLYYTVRGDNVYELTYRLSMKIQNATDLPIFHERYAYLPQLIYILLPFYNLYLYIGGDPRPIKITSGPTGISLVYEENFYLSTDVFLFSAIIKMPFILADILIVYILGRVNRRLALVYALSSYSILISAIWGMFESIIALALILAIILVYRGKFTLAGLVYGFSLIKLYTMLTFPPIFIYLYKRSGFKSIVEFMSGLIISQIPSIAYLILSPREFIYSIIVFHALRPPSGLTPLRALNLLEDLYLSSIILSIYTLASILIYSLILYYISRSKLGLSIIISIILLYFLTFSKVVHEQYYLSLYPLLLLIDYRRARVIEVLFVTYTLLNTGIFLAIPPILFVIDYRFIEFKSDFIYGDLGIALGYVVGPLLFFSLAVITFTILLKTLVDLTRGNVECCLDTNKI